MSVEGEDRGPTYDLDAPLPDLELQSAIDRESASFQEWAETYFFSLKAFTEDDDDARRNYRHYRPGGLPPLQLTRTVDGHHAA